MLKSEHIVVEKNGRGDQRRVTLTWGELNATANTETGANQQLEADIDRALTGHYTPELVIVHGQQGLLYRTIDGWTYAIVRDGGLSYCGGYKGPISRDRVRDSLRMHLAQNAWRPDLGSTADRFVEACGIQDDTTMRELKHWVRWQQFAAEARALGAEDNGCKRADELMARRYRYRYPNGDIADLTGAQMDAIEKVKERFPDAAVFKSESIRVEPEMMSRAIMLNVGPMWLGIEPDGYTHS